MLGWLAVNKAPLLLGASGASAIWGAAMGVSAVLSQAVNILPSTPSGWAGWASFLSSGGVLAWLLLKHLPEKDKQMERMVESRDQLVQNVATVFGQNLRDVRDEFKGALDSFRTEQRETRHDSRDALNVILLQHEKQYRELAAAMKLEFEQIAKKLEGQGRAP